MDINSDVVALDSSNISHASSLGSRRAWLVCLSAALFFLYDFVQLNMCNSLSKVLMQEFSIGAVKLSYISASFLLPNVIFLFPAGLLLDRVSTRKVTLLMLALSIFGTFGLASSTSFQIACIFRGISGIAHAFCFLCCMLLVSRWFPPNRRALVVGVVVTMAMFGGYIAQAPLAQLSSWIGWRQALMVNSGVGVSILFLNWLFVYDYPKDQEEANKKHKEALSEMGFWKSLYKAVSNIQNWLYGIYTGLLNLPIMVIGAAFGILYLTQVRGISDAQAPHITSMIFIGMIVGCPLVGWISDWWGRRKAPMLFGVLISIATISLILYGPALSFIHLLILFFILGFVTSAQVISYPAIAEINDKAISSASMGLASFLIMGLGTISQPIAGKLLERYWDGVVINKVSIYSSFDFVLSFSIITLGFVIALIAVMLIKETYCRSND